ncbi:hypothetical protein [Streptococcus ovuberis]|uniref:Uncharacterized protein n=1 Tax=Streptococcus ovuberis TaxID=1936207 RepID=A0A7X6MWC0_9STRE|nr:hypothetical protein [Streptococcus ovuberis]NKZ19590.1 hypothetical protein [Streptococcus ovuberis]
MMWYYNHRRALLFSGTAGFLYWQAISDSGNGVDGNGFTAPIGDGAYLAIHSKNGTYFKTYNPANGSYDIVSNPI